MLSKYDELISDVGVTQIELIAQKLHLMSQSLDLAKETNVAAHEALESRIGVTQGVINRLGEQLERAKQRGSSQEVG